MESKTTTIAGRRVHFREAGNPDNPGLLLVHGGDPGIGPGGLLWSQNIDELASHGYHVIAPDRVGYGWSDPLADPADHNVDLFVDHLEALVDQCLRGEVYGLIGQSRGALLAALLWMRRPGAVSRVIFPNTNSLAPAYGASNTAALAKGEVSAREQLGRLLVNEPDVAESWWSEVQSIAERPEIILTRQTHALARADYLANLGQRKLEAIEWLTSSAPPIPVMLTWGDGDVMTTLDDARDVYRMVAPRSPTVMGIVNRCGHFPFFERADWFNRTAAMFLADDFPPGPGSE